MFHMLLRILVLLTSLTQFGCAPLFFDEPYQKAELNNLFPGMDQQSIKEILGEPQAIRAGGKFWFYGKTRPVFFYLVKDGGGTVEDYNWIELAFDDAGKLAFFDVQEGKTGCTQSGNCLLWGAWVTSDKWESHVMTNLAIIATPDKEDFDAKQFLPNKNMCSIYVYFDSSTATIARVFLQDDVAQIQVADKPAFVLNRETYFRVESSPGNLSVKVSNRGETSYSCEPEKIGFLFIHQEFKGLSYNWVDQSTGQKAISKRRLLLAP